MASNPPPFQVEDNTDEDFFDKLVNDDDDDVGFAATSSSSYAALPDDGDDDSDEVKAFSNLSIDELNNNNNNGEVITYDAASSSNHRDEVAQPINKVEQSRDPPLVSSDSFEFGHLMMPIPPDNKNGDVDDDAFSDSMVVSKDNNNNKEDSSVASAVSMTTSLGGSGAPGVKEVGWSAFHADSAENGGNGFGSYSDFFTELGGGDNDGDAFDSVVGDNLGNGSLVTDGSDDVHASTQVENSNDFAQFDEGYNNYGIPADQSAGVQDLNSSQYWENQYPGWKFDSQTGQWYQVDGYDAGVNSVANLNSDVSSTWGVAEGQSEVSYLQQSAHSIAATVADTGTTESVTNWKHGGDATETTRNWNQVSGMSGNTTGVDSGWNQKSQDNNEYPPHMVFDPQYPGWYYDTTAQEWRTLESYAVSAQPTAQVQDQMSQKGYASSDAFSHGNEQMTYSTHDQGNNYVSQGSGSQGQQQNWAGSVSNYNQPSSTMWQPDNSASNTSLYSGSQLTGSHYTQNHSVGTQGSPQSSVHYGATGTHYENTSPARNNFSIPAHSQGYGIGGNISQQLNDARMNQNDQRHVSNEHFRNQNAVSFSHQQILSAQVSYSSAPGRSSAGRPAHALVAFGFGGKLIVMKDSISSENMSFGSQNPVGGSISVLNLAEVVNDNIDASGHYFQALCKRSVPGPLAGGSVGTKELNKWIDERIANPDSAEMDYRKAEVLRLLLSLLKIACQYYGKLRSPYGTDAVMKESDAPESAVAKLFASVKSNSSQYSQYAAAAQCLQQLPSEGQMRVTATEVQSLLVSGRKKDALQRAQEGQLWGPALVLAAQLGDQFYVETVKQMALRQLVAGSPLRTLCLLIAGQPADVFSADTPGINSMSGAINMPQQPIQFGANGMLDDWEENLAVITANRTKDDELVLVHLGDCLWKDKSDIIAAHICYLVAETSFESYSDSARVCLVGADHWKFPRTYASPEAIQRTEIYEYSKTLGNSQFVLLPFQPYKLVYAHMLAEVGRISDALKYCQAVLKSLKTGRTPEVETLRQLASSLEERIKTHQQGGFSANLSSNKLVGKLLNLFDTTAHKVVGGLPPPAPTAGGSLQGNENLHQSIGPRVSASQSTMAMSSLVPSLSVEPISDLAANNNRVSMHTRSVSEPDFGRSQESSSTGKATGVTSRFGRFGFGSQLLQKTVGLVLKPRQGRQAKLGETNKFYYDEKLKRWVEEGSDPPAEEAALPPPPTTTVFQNGTSDYNLRSALQSEASLSNGSPEFKSPSAPDNSSGMPPLPPISNQYSARGRMGVRSRYVDTFNKGGGNATNLFQSPSLSSAKPATGAKPQFFVPTPVTTVDQPIDASQNGIPDPSSTYENPSPSSNDSLQSSIPPSSVPMQRFASMNNISRKGSGENNSFSAHSRRTASWSGSFNNTLGSPQGGEVRPLGEVLGMPPSSFMPNDPSPLGHSSLSGGSVGDDLQEVEL